MNIFETDYGGAMFIHVFGAYFGLGVSWLLTPTQHITKMEKENKVRTSRILV